MRTLMFNQVDVIVVAMKAAPGIRTPQQYLASLGEERRAGIRALHNAIRKAAPALKPGVHFGMLGYGLRHYKYASGREGDWPVVALASQKHHFSLYLCACDQDGYLPVQNKQRLGKVSVGKSCIRFRKLEDLDLKVAMELVKRAARLAGMEK